MRVYRRYQSGITARDWNSAKHSAIRGWFEARSRRPGRPRVHDPRLIINAIRYLAASGVPFRSLPCHFPKWQTVAAWKRSMISAGVYETVLRGLVDDLEELESQAYARADHQDDRLGEGRAVALLQAPLENARAAHRAEMMRGEL